jgi:pimeloyl-ACP methyl ester carboxylesterase
MREGATEVRRVVRDILSGGDRGAFHDLLVEDIYSAAFVRSSTEALAERRRQLASLPDAWFAAIGDLVAAVETFDLRAELANISCPTLVVVAGDDRVMPPERGRAVAAAIPGAELAEHPTSGHALVAEHPEWLALRAIELFDRAAVP